MADSSMKITFTQTQDTSGKFDFKKKPQIILENRQIHLNNTRPDKNVPEYQKSKIMTDLKKMCPESSRMPLEGNPQQKLMILKGKLFANEKKLDLCRKHQKKARDHMLKEWGELESMELDFREQFISFNNFVTENHDKRARVSKRLLEDRRLIEERKNQIVRLNEKLQETKKATAYMESNIKIHDKHKAYLDQVVELSPHFSTITDIVVRYDNLVNARNYLGSQQRNELEVLENSKLVMMKLIEDKNFIIMGLNNQIANLQARYENANIKALESEELVTQIKNNAVKQLNEIDTVKNSIWNLYVHMASSKKHPVKIKKENVEEQMMYVNRTLTELNKVNKLIKKRAAKLSKQ